MTHELVGVVVDPFLTRATVQDAVEKIMAPFQERYDDDGDEDAELIGWWDYWTIGGRWTGVWEPGYDPREDPLNIDPNPCFICGGTGQRPDTGGMTREEYIAWCGGCNGCQGKGHTLKWERKWNPRERDCLPVAELIADESLQTPLRLVLPDAGVVEKCDFLGTHSWDPSPLWDAEVRRLLAPFAGANIVAVDIHI